MQHLGNCISNGYNRFRQYSQYCKLKINKIAHTMKQTHNYIQRNVSFELLYTDSFLYTYLKRVLQNGRRPSSDFLTKILGVDTPLFLCNTQLYFPCPLLLLHKCSERRHPYVNCNSSVGSMFACGVSDQVKLPVRIFFCHQVYNSYRENNFIYFLSLHICLFSFILIHIQEWVE
jgi:hypothetical protein